MRRRALALWLALLVGCVDPQPEWERVEQTVSERGEGAALRWEQTEEDAQEIARQVGLLREGGLSRAEAVQVALLANRDLQATFEEVGLAKAALVQAQLPTNPNAEGIFRFPVGGGRTAVESGLLLWVSDLWLVPLRARMQQAAAAATLRRVEGEVVDTAVEAALDFDQVLYRQARLELQRQAVQVQSARAARLAVRFGSGQANDLEVHEAEARLGEEQVRAARAERDLALARARLAALLNLEDAQLLLTGELAPAEPRRWSEEEAVSYAREHRLDLAQARIAVERADRAVDLERARIFDQVRAGGDHEGRVGGDHEAGPSLSLELPLFDQNQAQIARAQYLLRQTRKRLQSLRVEVGRQTRQLLAEVDYRRAHVALFLGRIEPALTSAATYAQRYGDLMRLDYLHLYQAQDHLLRAREEYLTSVFGLRRAHTLLQGVLLGGGRSGLEAAGAPLADTGELRGGAAEPDQGGVRGHGRR